MVTLSALRRIAEKETNLAGPKYTPGIDAKAPNLPILSLLRDIDCLVRSKSLFKSLSEFLREFKDSDISNTQKFNWFDDQKYTPSIIKKYVSKILSLSLVDNFDELEELREMTENIFSILEDKALELREKQRKAAKTEVGNRRDLQEELYWIDNAIKTLRQLRDWTNLKAFQLINSPFFFLSGVAGSGKTHFLCDITKKRLENGFPTLLVLGQKFIKITDPLQNIAEETKLAKNKMKLLSDLEKLAVKSGERALIIIDAINESDCEGWKQTLWTLIKDLEVHPAVAVIISARTPYEKIILSENNKTSFLLREHYGFEDIEFDASMEFFEYYKLPIPEIPLLFREFSNPLFLNIFCKSLNHLATDGKKARLKEIFSGQKTLTKIFEDYIKYCGEIIARHFRVQPETCWNIVKGSEIKNTSEVLGVATVMADHFRDWILPEELKQILKIHTNLVGKKLDELIGSFIEHGILAKDIMWDEEIKKHFDIIRFPYQKISDHIIARHLLSVNLQNLQTIEELKDIFSPERQLGKIFILKKEWGQYSKPGLAEAITMEFPERIRKKVWVPSEKKEVYEFLPVESKSDYIFLRYAFLPGLYWRANNNFSKCTDRYIDILLNCRDKTLLRETLEVLTTLATREQHPYKAKRLHDYLKDLTLVHRDLLWTEFLRSVHNVCSIIDSLLKYLEKSSGLSITKNSIENLMYILVLLLSSTEPRLRDKATRFLYIYGKKNPEKLFELCQTNLNSNDPYVPERLLAASYGVAICSLSNASINKQRVQNFARQLYNCMFAENAQNSTPHILSRDYAARTIQLAEFIQPGSFAQLEISRTKASFPPMGIVLRWGMSNDKDEGKYRDGNYPLLELEYTGRALYSLTKNGGYQAQDEELKNIKARIFWRLYDLGYDLAIFEEIDKTINSLNYAYGNSDIRWVETYGQKYSWIAYYELAGWLLDQKKLPLRENRFRIGEAKIDPTFPSVVSTPNFLGQACFGKKGISAIDWVKLGGTPNATSLLNKQNIGDINGPWVLLDGHVRQKNQNCSKRRDFFIRGIFVHQKDKAEIIRLLKRHAIRDVYIPQPYSDYLVYAGEIPWCETFVKYDSVFLSVTVDTIIEQIKDREIGFKKNGSWLEKQLEISLLEKMREACGDDKQYSKFKEDLQNQGIDIDCKEIIRPSPRQINRDFPIFLPVRIYEWEGNSRSESALNRAYILEKEIIDKFKLVLNSDGMNFFDNFGAQITYNVKFYASDNDNYDLIYMKKDFLDAFLTEANMAFLWVMLGERTTNVYDNGGKLPYAEFKVIYGY